MSKQTRPVISKHTMSHGSTASYVVGFVLSLIFTIIPFLIVMNNTLSGWLLTAVLVAFAITQLLVQLVFFLHLGKESSPRWNLFIFLLIMLIIAILVIGSLWIMDNLDYRMMPHEVEQHIIDDEGIYR